MLCANQQTFILLQALQNTQDIYKVHGSDIHIIQNKTLNMKAHLIISLQLH